MQMQTTGTWSVFITAFISCYTYAIIFLLLPSLKIDYACIVGDYQCLYAEMSFVMVLANAHTILALR